MGMNIFKLALKFNSQAIITRRRTRMGFTTFTDNIPATTLRGALLTSLYWHGRLTKNELKREALDPTVIASPAYPLAEGTEFYPSHPFIIECKICRSAKNYLSEKRLRTLRRDTEILFPTQCGEGHPALKPLHPQPVGIVKDGLVTWGASASVNIAVAISKRRGTSMKEMLYEYEAISAGRRFWASIVVPEDLALKKGTRLWLGRGKSRGFGEAEIVKLDEIDLGERAEMIEDALRPGRRPILYALSPLTRCRGEENGLYPTEIDLGEIAERMGVEATGRLIIERVHGREGEIWGGWDMMSNSPRPKVMGCLQGSIAMGSLRGVGRRQAALAFAALEHLGTVERPGEAVMPGVNLLALLEAHPIHWVR